MIPDEPEKPEAPAEKPYSVVEDLKETYREHRDAVKKLGRGIERVYRGIFGSGEE